MFYIIECMTYNNLISNTQHGFWSCMTQFLTSMEYWTDEIQKGNPVDVLYVNFKLSITQLKFLTRDFWLLKLKAYGITGKLDTFIPHIGRKQRVTINNFKSTWVDVVSGVPQGSVLGLIFFLMTYLMCYPIPAYLLLADDTKIYSHIRSEDDIIFYVNCSRTLISYWDGLKCGRCPLTLLSANVCIWVGFQYGWLWYWTNRWRKRPGSIDW